MNRIGLVIFDCDGVLVDSERLAIRVDAEQITALGWPITPDEIAKRFVGASKESQRLAIEQRIGQRLPEDWQAPFEQAYWELVDAELTPVPGVREIIERLAVPFCVASNGSHEKMRRSLARVGLLPLLKDVLFSADDVPAPKPAPDLHRHAAARMGVRPAETVVVEDSRSGIEAATAAGMRTYGFASGVTPLDNLVGRATTVIHSMAELAVQLERAGALKPKA